MSNKRLELDYELGFYSESQTVVPGSRPAQTSQRNKILRVYACIQFKIYCRRTLITS